MTITVCKNIQLTINKTYKIVVYGEYLGRFKTLEKAKAVRDEYRAKHGYSRIED